MIRITTLFLCVLLAAAAWGRYRAEEEVRKTRAELEKLEISAIDERRAIQMLRAEIAYLENPARLAKVADMRTDLRPSDQSQLLSARQFVVAMGGDDAMTEELDAPPPSNVITNAVAMALNQDIEQH